MKHSWLSCHPHDPQSFLYLQSPTTSKPLPQLPSFLSTWQEERLEQEFPPCPPPYPPFTACEAAAFLSHGLLRLPELWDGFRPLVLLQGSYSIKYSIAFSSASHRTQSWTFFSLSTLLGQSHSRLQIQLQLEADDPKAVNCKLVLNPESSRPTLVYPLAY